jgi:hypothetical protein
MPDPAPSGQVSRRRGGIVREASARGCADEASSVGCRPHQAPLAQLDRASASEAEGHWFESSVAREVLDDLARGKGSPGASSRLKVGQGRLVSARTHRRQHRQRDLRVDRGARVSDELRGAVGGDVLPRARCAAARRGGAEQSFLRRPRRDGGSSFTLPIWTGAKRRVEEAEGRKGDCQSTCSRGRRGPRSKPSPRAAAPGDRVSRSSRRGASRRSTHGADPSCSPGRTRTSRRRGAGRHAAR